MAYAHADASYGGQSADSRALLPLGVALGACFVALSFVLGALVPMLLFFGLIGLVACVIWPRLGLHATLLLGVVGDMRISGDVNNPTFAKMFSSLQGFSITPLELLMLCSFLGLLIRLAFDDDMHLRMGELALPIFALTGAVLLATGWGIMHGADMAALRAEVRGFFYIPVLYLIVVHFVRTRAHLTQLVWVFIIATNVMAIDSTYRYFYYVRGSYNLTAAYDLAFAHENALYCAAAIMILLSRLVWTKNVFGEWKSLAFIIMPMTALIVMGRRAGIVALDSGILLLAFVLLRENPRKFLIVVPIGVLLAGGLLAATWNSAGGSGQFARSFQTVIGQDTTARDQSSDNYRTYEEENVRLNIQASPFLGSGFGRQYAFYIPLANLSFWPLWHYVPHNTVLWVWMKAGALGFAALLALFAAALMRSMQVMKSAANDTMKPLIFSMGSIVFMILLYSWVDLGLISPRALILFSVALGAIVSIGRLSGPGSIPMRRR